jgi:4-hydroxy-tetrahydrodipicolinate synthase
VEARRLARELDDALAVLSSFDEGPDLVLYYKYLLVLLGEDGYRLHFNGTDELSDSQKHYAENQLQLFQTWWKNWAGQSYETS